VLREFVRFAAANPALHRFMIQEGVGRSPRLAWLVETPSGRSTTSCAR
jgi:hypothetical protein